jgi:Ribbon-helix-helix domain
MSRKKISTTIYVTPEQNEQLKLLHARTKVPIAVFIREGIDLVLSRHAHLLPGQLQLSAPLITPVTPLTPEPAFSAVGGGGGGVTMPAERPPAAVAERAK